MPAHPLLIREREEIRCGIIRGETVTAIAERIGRHRCTVSAEISRNGGRDAYRAFRAQDRAVRSRKRPKARSLELHPELGVHVAERLAMKDSPMTIRCRRPQQHWRGTMRPIAQRPAIADARSEVGHFEGDLIIGGQDIRSAIITVFDRTSRHLWMAGLPNGRTADLTLEALAGLLERIPPSLRRTLTWDQGSEMAHHDQLAERCGIDVYFADPHSPWQRPTNENGNGLIRRYVGKRTSLAGFTPTDIRAVEDRINTMPRRVLNWTTAQHVYHQAVVMTG